MAVLLDAALLGLAVWCFVMGIGFESQVMNAISLIMPPLVLIIQFFFIVLYRQSVGKEIVGIQPVSIHTGQPLSATRYFMRMVLSLIWALILVSISGFVYLIVTSIMIMSESNNRRTLDDLLAGSVVVRVR